MDSKVQTSKPLSRRSLLKGLVSFLGASTGIVAFATHKAAGWDKNFELAVEFEILRAEGRRYLRPYVAVWIENESGKSIRTISLWFQQTQSGPRWLPDLKRWFKGEQSRKATSGGDLAKTVSSATRQPGKYSVVWDGRDDSGKYVPQGTYKVCIEVAREHGTYQVATRQVTVGAKPFSHYLGENIEMKDMRVEYRKRQ